MGLTLVRSLVAMHGGDAARGATEKGRGQSSSCDCPWRRQRVLSRLPARRRTELRLPKHAKVAIIEDNADSREMLCEALTLAGFECRSADNGVDGLALVDAMRPDVAIVDVGLPGMNGFELARRVRADPRHANVRLMALTGYGQREDRERAIAAGFDDHLVKPVDPTALVAFLEGR